MHKLNLQHFPILLLILLIIFLADAKQLNVRAYNLSGQLLHSQAASGYETNIDASSWAKGVYLIQVNGSPAQRIVIY